ncbi:endolytic peptidoglycan transglycosylase RlpA [Campylobacterota bacterium]|nr:endolytic peptidoglycan transglycosylase RlpA [Campylobacterota bacterium]
MFVSAILIGCSERYQQVGFVSGYYSTGRTQSSGYAAQEPTRADGTALMHRATLKGYTVLGKRYYPQIRAIGWRENGIASWYGPDFHGKKTSNGEIYDMYSGTAAHKTLPMNTIVLVTHKQNGSQVKVRINDRGPFVEGRIIDLSYTAGKALGLDRSGTAQVTLEVLEYDRHISAQLGAMGGDTRVAAPVDSVIVPVKSAPVVVSQNKTQNTPTASKPAAKSSDSKYAIQLGSFKNLDGANKLKTTTTAQGGNKSVMIKTVEFGGEKLHRVLIDGFATKAEAQDYMHRSGLKSGVIVALS